LAAPTVSFRSVVAHGCGPEGDGVTALGEPGAGAVAVTVTVLVGVAAGVEEPQAAVRASEVRQDPARASRPVIADALMDSLSSGDRRSL
jgi:hypothetical protein